MMAPVPISGQLATDKHIFLMYSHMTGGQYLLGDYDGARDKFVVTDGGLFNFGPSTPSGVHAPSAAPDGKGGVVVIFNMNQGIPTQGWNQIMTLPRLLTLDDDGRLLQQPAGDIESLRYDHQQVDAMTLPPNQEIVLDDISGNAMELALEIDPGDAPLVELNLGLALAESGRIHADCLLQASGQSLPPAPVQDPGDERQLGGDGVPATALRELDFHRHILQLAAAGSAFARAGNGADIP